MKVESFQALLAQMPSLTEAQLDELVLAVEKRRSKTKALRVLEGAWGAPKCGHCASGKVVKNGHSRGPAALLLPRLREDLQYHHRHTAGRASQQGALLRAGRVPRSRLDRA